MVPDELRNAQHALDRVRDDLMSRAGVRAVFVGLLPDAEGALTGQIGIRVVVDPVALESGLDLPDSVGDVPVHLESGTPALERRRSSE